MDNPRAIAAALDGFDWAEERRLGETLGESGCPPGLGIVRADGAILHILPTPHGYDGILHNMPVQDDAGFVSGRGRGGWLSRLFRSATHPMLDFHDAPRRAVLQGVQAFLDNRTNATLSHLEVTP